ncbi:MAG: hypothetical protein CMN30_05900 [Sandaracinus sp.]|nr:hypothetical protein [Sandaracinus sp.]|tara:strand:+ start:2623 stop:3777 length:1155 start_codon:yes stop_codon:yes gene_type:complete
MSEPKRRRVELRVGIFVVVALIIGGTLAFVIGNQQSMFKSKNDYHAIFDDVGGLRAGNTVRIAGVSVGSVDSVMFRDDGRVEVHFRIVEDAARLIRGNPGDEDATDDEGRVMERSAAVIGSKGMLGDRLIDITVGDGRLPTWDPAQPLPTSEEGDLFAMVEGVAGDVQEVVDNLKQATDPLGDPAFGNDIRETAHNLARLTGMLAGGDGLVQRLMTDPSTADDVEETLANIRATSNELRRTARSARAITEEVERGDGTAHTLIYGQEGKEALENIGRASGELAQLLGDVRTGDGTVHDLIYEDAADEMVANLTQASEDIAAVTGEIRAGRGTIGGLVMDPSIYEDVKRLVGDLERNEILRALVRYSIRRDDSRGDADVTPVAEE